MARKSYYEYIKVDGAELFTVVCLPDEVGTFPTILFRKPYHDTEAKMTEDEVVALYHEKKEKWLARGYAFVHQHCRGRGKSTGDFVPYINEREDGLALQEWVRKQPFYNGELFLLGGSYSSSVHYVTAPFAPDIKGAVLGVQDSERYNIMYRNGFFNIGLHGRWYASNYKKNTMPEKPYVHDSYLTLPLKDFSKVVFGEEIPSFDEPLKHPDKNDPFWNTRAGGGEARGATDHAGIPILFTTGYYDLYTRGTFDMWRSLDEKTRVQCALLVNPYDHSGTPKAAPYVFENGTIDEQFGDYERDWFDYVRGKCEAPCPVGKVSYYKMFGEGWCTDDFAQPEKSVTFTLGEGEKTYRYNPYAPASFKGGLSGVFYNTAFQDQPNSRYDILSFYLPAFEEDTFIKGRMSAKLTVRSTCEDTCFYVRVSLAKEEGDLGMRDDINQISNFNPAYVPGEEQEMTFEFDEHAFVAKKGERLRVDISSSAHPYYVRHTNNRGLFSEQATARIADNTVILDKSSLTVYFE